MESRFIYALSSSVLTGLFSFSSKISVEKNHNPSLVTFYSMCVATICAIIFFFVSQSSVQNLGLAILLGAINGSFYLVTILTRIKSLKYIDTSIYFPIYKAILPIMILFIVIVFFGEVLNYMEIIGVLIGITVPLILIGKNKKSTQIKKGMLFLIIGMSTALIAGISVKVATINDVNMILYSTFSLFTAAIGTFILMKKDKKKVDIYSISKIKRIGIITGILNFFAFYFFVKAVDLSNSFGIIYTIHSLYIVVPIILAIIVYREHFDIKKAIAVILTIVSLYFLK